ncbi:alanine--tRNA ligase, partial [Candidatus Parcubacteria bacterium]|nr:alanine--tRNA ligase [Candidatus Parcubacteria bacterium]
PKEDNWWGPIGETGPCGPDTEMFYDTGKEACGPDCRPGCHCGKYFEIWNNVFMEFNRRSDGTYEPLKQKNVDTGMGIERTVAMLQGKDDVYQTELFTPIIKKIEELSGRNYTSPTKSMRIIADHIRAAVFCIADGVVPANVERGYVVRRLIRRAVRHGHLLGIEKPFTAEVARVVVGEYQDLYPELAEQEETIVQELSVEEGKFGQTLERGLREFDKLAGVKPISGEEAFDLYQTYGFPLELTKEMAGERGLVVDEEGFAQAFAKHQEKSRAGLDKKFAGGLADQSEIVTRYHTATHLLHAALRQVLGEQVHQKGSNITPERLRFDFSHPEKMTAEQIKQVEDLVNQKIKENLPVAVETMSLAEAEKQGALAFFGQKYGDQVKVYSIGQFSKEVCGGPHIESTGELGNFKILKEKSVGRGLRRIRAVLKS